MKRMMNIWVEVFQKLPHTIVRNPIMTKRVMNELQDW